MPFYVLIPNTLQGYKEVRNESSTNRNPVGWGMSCAGCESRGAQSLEKLAGVSSVSVNSHEKMARVRGENMDATALILAAPQAGFRARTMG